MLLCSIERYNMYAYNIVCYDQKMINVICPLYCIKCSSVKAHDRQMKLRAASPKKAMKASTWPTPS